MVPNLINKDVFEPSYNDLKLTVQNHSYICINLIQCLAYNKVLNMLVITCSNSSSRRNNSPWDLQIPELKLRFSRSEASLCLSALFLLPLSLPSPDSYVYFWVQSELRSHFSDNFIKNKVSINYLQPLAARLEVNPPFLVPGPVSIAYLWNSSVPWQPALHSWPVQESSTPQVCPCRYRHSGTLVLYDMMAQSLGQVSKEGKQWLTELVGLKDYRHFKL